MLPIQKTTADGISPSQREGGRGLQQPRRLVRAITVGILSLILTTPSFAAMTEYSKVRLRSLDKITARTMTFDAVTGSTVKFGSMYIKVLSCQKPDLSERPEAAAFLQIWELTNEDLSRWIFSGWMFASSPALSAIDHPIYDVWVLDCLNDAPAPGAASAKSITDVVDAATGSQTPQLLLNPSSIPMDDNAPTVNAGSAPDGTAATPGTIPMRAEGAPATPATDGPVEASPPANLDAEWYTPQAAPSEAW